MSKDFICNMAKDCDQAECLHHMPHEHVSVGENEFCTDEYGYCNVTDGAVICVHKSEAKR